MSKIKNIKAREILDSRGNPTVEVDIFLEDESTSRASVPSGASTGIHEAVELRDGDKKRYEGKGVLKAVDNIEREIKDALLGMEADQQRKIDEKMINLDGTSNKERLGANAILGVSLAVAKTASISAKIPLYEYLRRTFNPNMSEYIMPVPMMNILNGGLHADSNLDFQEFLLFPVGAKNFSEAVRMGSEIFHRLGDILKKNHLSTNVGNEGGYAADFANHEHALKLILEAVDNAGYKGGSDAYTGFDVAASSFYKEGKYNLALESSSLSSEQMIDYLDSLINN